MPGEGYKLVDDATTPHLTKRIGHFMMEVRPAATDVDLSRAIIEKGEYSNRVAIGPGYHWLDVGANIGAFALQAAAAGSAVYAFEPEEINFQMLNRNVDGNGYPFSTELQRGVACYPAAISDKDDRTLPFYINRYRGKGSHSLFVKHGRNATTINNYHIASVLDSIPAIDCIKIDAEGAEWGIITAIRSDQWARIKQIVFEYHFNILKDKSKEGYLYLVSILSQHFTELKYRAPEDLGGNWHTIVSARK